MISIQITQRRYFIYGVAGLFFILLAHLISMNQALTQIVPPIWWQIGTGVLMLSLMAFQWSLFYYKVTKNVSATKSNAVLHKYTGILFMLMFALHTPRLGHALTLVLSIVFFAVAITGLLNRGFIRYSFRWMHKVWLWLHIMLSAALIPLTFLHIVVALMFE